MSNTLYIHATANKTLLALHANKQFQAFYGVEKKDLPIGSLVRGKVSRKMANLKAVFLDIGQPQQAFLTLHDAQRFADINEGQRLLVQVQKEAYADKGARVTVDINWPTRYFVWKPKGMEVQVSKQITATEERQRLATMGEALLLELQLPGGGMVRTLAAGQGFETLQNDMQVLSAVVNALEEGNNSDSLGLVLAADDFVTAMLRDGIGQDINSIIVDNEDLLTELQSVIGQRWPVLTDKLQLVTEHELLQAAGLESCLYQVLAPQVPLPSGGNLTIEKTEAMWVIDVNSGSQAHADSKQTNEEAARETVRQCRLRCLSGIIMVDFISGKNRRAQEQLLQILRKEFAKDPIRTSMADFSASGLLEINRARKYASIQELFATKCQNCGGSGWCLTEL